MSSESLAKLAEEFFQASLDSSPTSAIMRGHKKYFDQIEELTDEKFEEEMENVQNFKSLFIMSCIHNNENNINELKLKYDVDIDYTQKNLVW